MPDSTGEAGREAEAPRMVTIPQMPALLEAAGLKKIGAARLRQLAAEDADFPEPIFSNGRTRVFDWNAVERYLRKRVLAQGERTDLQKQREEPPSDGETTDQGPNASPGSR
ncbi:hypothetical protein [Streptomyces sp. NPDC056987]|uniref:hypothetical protein n=1 Tax=Streptomyces sp. NPDC056987 TaxID=3345988 RepID=UPI0036447E40